MFDVGSITHPGNRRRRNEDSFLVRTDSGLWAVADGMGGHEAGDVASRTVTESLDDITAPTSASDLLEQCKTQMLKANAQIAELSRQHSGATIGTTVAILLIREDHFACVWAGDSRIYRATSDTITQLSLDHTELQELIAAGALTSEEAKSWPSNIITRAIGVASEPNLDIVTGEVEAGDVFVLCSDGLTRHLDDREIHDAVFCHDAQQACDAMLALTLARGGHDNVTVVVVRTPMAKTARETTISSAVRPLVGARP